MNQRLCFNVTTCLMFCAHVRFFLLLRLAYFATAAHAVFFILLAELKHTLASGRFVLEE